MSESEPGSIPFDQIADSFVARLRKGERPALTGYVERYPQFAVDILELFPALAEMEGLKSGPDDATGSVAADSAAFGQGPALPARLGDYRILRLIGEGGIGVVYEARRESLSTHVALKVLHHRFRAEGSFLRRFRNEARAAASLHHTNIVPVFDFGEHDGILYYVMQYIPGQGLDRVLTDVRRLREAEPSPAEGDTSALLTRSVARGLVTGQYAVGGEGLATTAVAAPSEPRITAPARPADAGSISALGGEPTPRGQARYHREVARIGAQVADALAHAHARGIQHRDIKPANLLLDARGNAWITDFGLAKCEGDEGEMTAPGDVPGTLRYIPAERLLGQSDRRGDIYALGVTLYEMIALRPAHDARDRRRLLRQILDEEPPPLRRLDPRAPRDLETIVHKAMARDVATRYQTAAALAVDLRRFLEDRPPLARRTSPAERAWRWCRRNPMVAAPSLAAAMLMIAVLIVSTVAAIMYRHKSKEVAHQLGKVKAAERETTKQLGVAEAAVGMAIAAQVKTKERLKEAETFHALYSLNTRRSGQRIDALAAVGRAMKLGRELEQTPDEVARLRTLAISALALPDIQITEEFGRWTEDVASVEVNDQFNLYCVTDKQGRCAIRRVSDDGLYVRLPDRPAPRSVAFGAGPWLVDRASDGTLIAWDISGPVPKPTISDSSVATWDIRPDGGLLGLAHHDGSLAFYELPSGTLRNRLGPGGVATSPFVRLHPTAPFVVVSSYSNYPVEIRHLDTGATLVAEKPWPQGGSFPGAWSPDGQVLAIPRGDVGTIALYRFSAEPATITHFRTIDGIDGGTYLAFNEAGDRLMGRGWTNFLIMYDVNTGREVFKTHGIVAPSEPGLRTDRARRRLFPGVVNEPTRRFGSWSVAEGRECRRFAASSPGGPFFYTAVSPDGRLAVGGGGGWFAVFDVETGREVGRVPIPGREGTVFSVFDAAGHLYTNTQAGCYRWPIREDTTTPGSVVIGPPQRLWLHPGIDTLATSRKGEVIAQALPNAYASTAYAGGWVLRRDTADPPINVAPGANASGAAVSPDGRWVAFGTGHVVVFDAASGAKVWTSPMPGSPKEFSRDGKWLATTGEDVRLYAAGSWTPGPRLGRDQFGCFSPDGKLAFLGTNEGDLRLVEIVTGRELARIELPERTTYVFAMTPDGTKLVTPHTDGVRVWDLRLIRAELGKLGLDWDALAFPPATRSEGLSEVRIVGLDLLDPNSTLSKIRDSLFGLSIKTRPEFALSAGDALVRLGLHELGLAAYNLGIRLYPQDGHLRMHRALESFRRGRWEAAAEDLRLAPPDGLRCVAASESRPRLAWAYHELGRDAEAAAVLEEELRSPSVASPKMYQWALRVLLAEFYQRDGKADRAEATLAAAAPLVPKPAEAANNTGWKWITLRADPVLGGNERQVPGGLLLARKAVELAPDEPIYINTLGMALYRSDRYAEARDTLEANAARDHPYKAWDLFPLAMCQHRLGEVEAARATYARAVEWMAAHGDGGTDAREMTELRAEAGQLLGVPR